MNNKEQPRTCAIWAIDPEEQLTVPNSNALRLMLDFAEEQGLAIQPAYVFRLSKDSRHSTAVLDDIALIREDLEKYLVSLGVQNDCLPPEVLIQAEGSGSGRVTELLDFADRRRAAFFIVSSHGRSGLPRMMFGSFAENLLYKAEQPVLFLNPAGRGTRAVESAQKKILFPTDFSPASKSALKDLLLQAVRTHSQVILYYSISLPLVSTTGFEMGVSVPDDYFIDYEKWAKEESERWRLDFAETDVPFEICIESHGADAQTASHIIDAAKRLGVGMIALASVSGKLTTFVAGSVARQVMRENLFPLFVYGPQALAVRQINQQSQVQEFVTQKGVETRQSP